MDQLNHAEQESNCRALWLAVLEQAVKDEDRLFLRIDCARFRETCMWAGVEPTYLIAHLKRQEAAYFASFHKGENE